MANLYWTDVTSYSRGQDRNPTAWLLEANEFLIFVTCSHFDYKGTWIASCEPFFKHIDLKVKSKEDAQSKAVGMVQSRLRLALASTEV